MDYNVYAAGEAALGWMNASAELSANVAVDWASLARRLLENVCASVQQAGGHIGHLKLHLAGDGEHLAGNVTNDDSPATIRGNFAQDVRQASLLLNARVQIHAEKLRDVAETSLRVVAAEHGVEAAVRRCAASLLRGLLRPIAL